MTIKIMSEILFSLAAWQAVLLCLLFAIIYVGSLYVWSGSINKNRDHPDTIRRRFISVGVVSVLVLPLLWMFGTTSQTAQAHSLFDWVGIRFMGFLPALILPLILTMILFAGPLSLHYMDGVFRLYLEGKYWTNSITNVSWLRNHIVAPASEEFIFRACMLPLLVPTFGTGWAIFVCPLFFGVAHFHHMIEKVIQGHSVYDAFKQGVFQMIYTTIFGVYSAFLFLRTGHLIAPVIAHAFCNHMGFPSYSEVMAYERPLRTRLILAFVAGLVTWMVVLYPLTIATLYDNSVYYV